MGRTSRVLAMQPVERIGGDHVIPNRSLFWRALLEKIIRDKLRLEKSVLGDERTVGKIAAKCPDFFVYVRKALLRLKLQLEISDAEIGEYLNRYQCEWKKINALYQFRCCWSSALEGLIALDRLCYLLEQDCIASAYVLPLFDAAKSPRCYALVALKTL